jgi:hypothetical protein
MTPTTDDETKAIARGQQVLAESTADELEAEERLLPSERESSMLAEFGVDNSSAPRLSAESERIFDAFMSLSHDEQRELLAAIQEVCR